MKGLFRPGLSGGVCFGLKEFIQVFRNARLQDRDTSRAAAEQGAGDERGITGGHTEAEMKGRAHPWCGRSRPSTAARFTLESSNSIKA